MSKKIATLDIEASGIHPESYPIEIGLVLDNGATYCSLIKPIDEWQYWDADAEALHRISRDDIEQFGRSVAEVAAKLNECLKEQTIYSDCWVLDQPWIFCLFQAAGLEPEFTLRDIIYCLSEDEYSTLGSTKELVEIELNIERHRATNDARILQRAYDYIVTQR